MRKLLSYIRGTPRSGSWLSFFACSIGVLLLVYGAVGLWISRGNRQAPAHQAACALWLCPDEFSYARDFELHAQSERDETVHPLKQYERELQLDPASAYTWAYVGEAEMDARNAYAAKYCFQQALARGPRSPVILVRAANLYFRLGDFGATMRYLRQVLMDQELTEYFTPVFLTYMRMGVPIRQVLDRGMPRTTPVAGSFLRFVMNGDDLPDAAATWEWMNSNNLADEKMAGEYVAFLLRKKEYERAADEWQGFNQTRMPAFRRTNWIYNGGFEQEPSASPLDWHITGNEDVIAGRVDEGAREGKSAVEIEFGGQQNVEFHGVFQQAVIPAGKWRITAFIKTGGITTDEGVGLRVYDAEKPERLDIRTEALTGTHEWTEVGQEFQGTETTLLRVEVIRAASRRFDNKIAGRAWIDSVELSPAR